MAAALQYANVKIPVPDYEYFRSEAKAQGSTIIEAISMSRRITENASPKRRLRALREVREKPAEQVAAPQRK